MVAWLILEGDEAESELRGFYQNVVCSDKDQFTHCAFSTAWLGNFSSGYFSSFIFIFVLLHGHGLSVFLS